jgi:hypothetical protein
LKTLEEFTADAAQATGPRVSELVKIRPDGVDPLGLRQINFNLMDQLLPQLNNVARHIRPLTVMAWGWHCAWACAERLGLQEVPVTKLRDVVDRIEVIFVWSQLITHGTVDLPGNEYLKNRMPSGRFKFGGERWTQIQLERKYSTALSAPANYGPSLFNLCFVRSGARRHEVRVHPMAIPTIKAIESLLGDDCQHPAFTKFGEVVVKYEELERWGKLWDMNRTTNAERIHISSVLGGKQAPLKRQIGIRLLTTTIRRLGDKEEPALRKGMCDIGAVGQDPDAREAVLTWRGIQARQLFRLALESMLLWATREVGDGTRTLGQLTKAFLDLTPKAATASASGQHMCQSKTSIGHTCSVSGVGYNDCNEASLKLKMDDCCPRTAVCGPDPQTGKVTCELGGSSIGFNMLSCLPQ